MPEVCPGGGGMLKFRFDRRINAKEIRNKSRSKQQISHRKERHQKACITERNVTYNKKSKFDFETTIRLYNDGVGRKSSGS